MEKSLVRISKFLSLILRHHPGAIGLELDEGGWADVEDLLHKAETAGRPIDRSTLERVVAENDKQRFAFSPDGRRIRANQGHSIPVDLGLKPQKPPERLFHGTADRFLDGIRQNGLMPRRRNYVHLSMDRAMAYIVGGRHGRPVVLTIRAGEMRADGYPFYLSENKIWLVERVPVEYTHFPELPGGGAGES